MPESDVTKMKVADLKRELKLRGLTVTGNKTELQDRLQAALLDGDLALEDTALPGDDLLDEDGVLTDEEEDEAKILAGDEEHDDLLKSPLNITPESVTDKSLTGTGAGAEDDILSTPPSSTTPKKIVLKRQTSASKNATTNTSKENTEPSPAKTLKMSERNPITIGEPKSNAAANDTATADAAAAKKLTQLSAQERLEMRAKKFGISANTADTAAAAKPATAPAAKKTNEPIVIEKTPAVPDEKQIELLKKRAERFGCVVSSKMVKLDIEERLEKRKQRFGGETAGSNTSTGGAAAAPSSDEWSEKARKRLERFGNAAANSTTTPTTTTTNTNTATTTTSKHPTIVAPNGVASSK